MTHIDKNYGPIIIGNYIGRQEIYIDKQLNIVNDVRSGAEASRQEEACPEAEADCAEEAEKATRVGGGTAAEDHTEKATGTGGGTAAESHTEKATEAGGGTAAEGHTEKVSEAGGRNPAAHFGERVARIFGLAEERGLLSRVEDGYVWHENNTLLDYFLGRALCGDYPYKGDSSFWCFGDEGRVMPANDMNRLFGRKTIGAIRRSRKTAPLPRGHERIDEIIDAFPEPRPIKRPPQGGPLHA